MKSFVFRTSLFILFSLFLGCKKDEEQPIEAKLYLDSVLEQRYTPDDSLTIQYSFDQDSMLVLEENSKGFSSKGIKDQKDIASITEGWVKYRLYTYNKNNQLVNFIEYFSGVSGGKSISTKDSTIYSGSKIIRQEHKNFRIEYYGSYGFSYPLWLIKRSFGYNNRNQITAQTDSIFITHDIAAGDIVIKKSEPKFVYTNQTSFEYNNTGEMIRKAAISNENTDLLYSNGSSAYDVSHPGKLRSGTTDYTYTYNSDKLVESKKAAFKDLKNGQIYTSLFFYKYKVSSF